MAFVTYGHHALIAGNKKKTVVSVFITILLAIVFTALQAVEYIEAPFSFADSIFGTTFFASTGLHGLITVVPIRIFFNKNF